MLSRFRTEKEQKKTLEELEAGKVDMVIGTHRILSKDVKFQDLGLLVVDEEQRFGVAHKERLKEMRKNVEVLTHVGHSHSAHAAHVSCRVCAT